MDIGILLLNRQESNRPEESGQPDERDKPTSRINRINQLAYGKRFRIEENEYPLN